MKTFLIFFSFFVCVVRGLFLPCSEYDMNKCSKCIQEYSNKILMPTYSLYLFGFFMILMLIIIICLAVLLYRTRTKEYKIFTPPNQLQPVTTNPDISRSLMSQTSHEMTILKMDSVSDVSPINQNVRDRHFGDNHNSLTTSISKDSKLSTIDRHTGLGKDFKVYRSVKKPTDQKLILKEQMKKICEDALAKSHINGMTASLKDLNELLNEQHYNQKPEEVKAQEKSSSYPELDVYDNVPSNIPVNEMAGEAVYDCLPTSQSKNIIVEDFDTKYLLAISKENLTEPAYINAQYRYNKF